MIKDIFNPPTLVLKARCRCVHLRPLSKVVHENYNVFVPPPIVFGNWSMSTPTISNGLLTGIGVSPGLTGLPTFHVAHWVQARYHQSVQIFVHSRPPVMLAELTMNLSHTQVAMQRTPLRELLERVCDDVLQGE